MSRQPEPELHYFKRFTKFTRLHFQNMQKQTPRLLNSTNSLNIAQQNLTCKPAKPLSNTQKPEKDQTGMKALPIQTNLFHQVPKPSENAPRRSKILHEQLYFCVIQREREIFKSLELFHVQK